MELIMPKLNLVETVTKPRGRISAFVGKKLTMADGKKNNRRAGSHGSKSLEIILKKPGIIFEDFIKAGGRSVDLRWDIKRGNVVIT